MGVALRLAPGCLSSLAMEVAEKECCQAQRVASAGRQGERRQLEDADTIIKAGMPPFEGRIGCVGADIAGAVAFVVTFVGDKCSQSSLVQGLRGCLDVFHSRPCRT
jgi:hypothetical protein